MIAFSTIVGSIGLLVIVTATTIAMTVVYLHKKKKKMTAKISELSNIRCVFTVKLQISLIKFAVHFSPERKPTNSGM